MLKARRPTFLDRALRPMSCCAAVVALVVVAPAAAADPEQQASVVHPRPPSSEPLTPVPTPATQPASELTAADVAADPLPGFESGRSDPVDTGDSVPRNLGRAVLLFPKLAIDLALTPVRGGVWAFERYRLPALYDRVFWNDAKTIGLYPTISVDSSLGVTAGARFVHRDLFGEREQLGLQASAGSRYRQIYAASFRTGNRFGNRFALELDAGYERRPHDAFYGIGNGDTVAVHGAPIDPLVDSTSVNAYYRQDRSRISVTSDLRVWDRLHVRANGAASQVRFGPGDQGAPIDGMYDPNGLVGWGGIRYGYGELELRWDGRHGRSELEPPSVYSAGSLVAVYSGLMHRLDTGPDFWRYGIDLQHFVRIGEGPRVISAHVHGEGVTGPRDSVPFTELPKLGGSTYLRGYALDRFRDRIAAFGSVAYQWDLSQWFSANLFVDVGRVYPRLSEVSVDHLRMGYGIGLEAHSVDSFVLEGSIGSSIDGGIFLNLSFNPVFDLDERVRRR